MLPIQTLPSVMVNMKPASISLERFFPELTMLPSQNLRTGCLLLPICVRVRTDYLLLPICVRVSIFTCRQGSVLENIQIGRLLGE